MEYFRQAIFFSVVDTDKLCTKYMKNKLSSGGLLTSSSFFYQSGNQILIISRVLAWCAPVEGEKPVVGHFMATACHQA